MFIKRDVFARQELHAAALIPNKGHTCDYCGSLNSRGILFTYRIETDGGRKIPIVGKFCGVRCMNLYHNSN